MRQCIEHLVVTSERAVWFNLTFWENVTNKAYANRCWNKLSISICRKYPGFRFVGVWARQRRGAWHIHGVCNMRLPVEWLRSVAMRSGFGPQCFLAELDGRVETPNKIARYITGYCTDKNGLDPVKDKGVRRMIFVGKHVRIMDMRYRSSLKRVTSMGREMAREMEDKERKEMSKSERDLSWPSYRKRASESWGDWYRRNRDYWFRLGWESLNAVEREVFLKLDAFTSRYLESGRWSYV
jgi:hypothetical protein